MMMSIVALAITMTPISNDAGPQQRQDEFLVAPGAIAPSFAALPCTAWTRQSRVPVANRSVAMAVQGDDIYLLSQDRAFLKYNTSGDLLWNTTAGVQGAPDDLVVKGTCYYITGTYLDKAYIAKFWLNHTREWIRWHNDSVYNYGKKVVVDGGDVYWLGGQGNTTDNTDGFATRFNSSGNQAWHVNHGVIFNDEIFENGIVFDSVLFILMADHSITDIVKCDLNGNFVLDGGIVLSGGKDHGNDILVFGGFIYVMGFEDWIGWGDDVNVFKLNSTLDFQSVWHWGGTAHDRPRAMYIANDTIVVAGSTLSFGVAAETTFLAAFTMNGTLLWKKLWTTGTSSRAWAIAPASGGAAIVAGDLTVGSTPQAFVAEQVPNTPPSIDSPADATGMDNDPLAVTWNATDSTVERANYTLLVNGTSRATGSWAPGTPIVVPIPTAAMGLYNCTLVVNDGLGLTANDSLVVNITNHPPRIFEAPTNITYEYNATGHVLSWRPYDYSANGSRRYEGFVDGSSIANGTWSNYSFVDIGVDGLGLGTHEILIRFHDGLGGTTESRANVGVYNVAPVLVAWISANLTATFDRSTPVGSTNTLQRLRITDASTSAPGYVVYINGTVNLTGTWQPGIQFDITLGPFGEGIYSVSIEFFDGLGSNFSRGGIIRTYRPRPPGIDPVTLALIIVLVAGIAVVAVATAVTAAKKRRIKARAAAAGHQRNAAQDTFDKEYFDK